MERRMLRSERVHMRLAFAALLLAWWSYVRFDSSTDKRHVSLRSKHPASQGKEPSIGTYLLA